MYKTIEKIATISDPVSKAVDIFLKYVGSAMRERYTTIDELGQDFNQLFQNFVQGVQDNYDRVYKDVTSRPSTYGIEVVGGGDSEDVVNEHGMENLNENPEEDKFKTDEEKKADKTNVNDVFEDENGETEGSAVTPQ